MTRAFSPRAKGLWKQTKNHPHNLRCAGGELKSRRWPEDLFYGQRNVDLFDGGVHVFQRLFRKSTGGLLEQALGGAQLGVGGALRFVAPAFAADLAAEFPNSQFDLFHGFDAMSLVVVVGLGECRIGVIQQGEGSAGLSVAAGHKAKNQHQRGQQHCITWEKVGIHACKCDIAADVVKCMPASFADVIKLSEKPIKA